MAADAPIRSARLVAALLAIATVAVLIGTLIERRGHHDTATAAVAAKTTVAAAAASAAAGEAGESGEGAHNEAAESTVAAAAAASAAPAAGEAGESAAQRAAEGGASEAGEFHPLGINVEKPALVAVGVAIPLIIAAALGALAKRWLFALAALAALAFIVLDVAELGHQANVHRWGLVVIAAFALLTHAAVTALGANALRSPARETVAA